MRQLLSEIYHEQASKKLSQRTIKNVSIILPYTMKQKHLLFNLQSL